MMNSHTLINVLIISFLGFEQCVNIVSGVNNTSVHSTTTVLGRNLSSTTKGLVHGSAVSSNNTSNAVGLPTRTFTTMKIKSSESVSSSIFSSSVSVNVSSDQSSPPLTQSVGKPQTTTSDYGNSSPVLLPSTSFLPFSFSDSVSLHLSSSLTPFLSSPLSRSNYSSNVSSFGRSISSSSSFSLSLSTSSPFFSTPPYSSTSSTSFSISSSTSFFSSAFFDSSNSSSSSFSSFFPSFSTSSSPSSSYSLSIFPSASVPSTNSSLLSDNLLYSSSSSSSSFFLSSFTFYSPSSSSDSSFFLSVFPSASVPSTNSSLLLNTSLYSSSISVNIMSSYSSLSTNISQSMLSSLVLSIPLVSQSKSSQFMPTSQLTFSLSSVFLTTVSSHSSFFLRPSTTRNKSSSSTIFTVLLASRTHVNQTQSSSLYMASETTMFTSLVKSTAPTVSSSRYTATIPSPSRGNTPTVIPMLLEFNGKLIVSVKHPSKLSIYDFKGISDSIERTLGNAFKSVQGYLYSKVLQIITQKKHGRIECHFKVFIKGPSQETSTALKERLNNYNSTKGFGEFTLHSVETSVGKTLPDNDELKLWTIIVIAVLGFLCLLLAVLLLCLLRRIKKLKAKKDISKRQDDNGTKEYQRYSTIFDGVDETQNIPLKLTKPRVSATESRKPLKSDTTTGTDSGAEGSLSENGEIRKMSEPSSSLGGDDNESENEEEDKKTSVQEPELPDNSLQINEVTEEDETKFSTFSRKRSK